MVYDSRVGFLDLKSLNSKDKLESDKIHKEDYIDEETEAFF